MQASTTFQMIKKCEWITNRNSHRGNAKVVNAQCTRRSYIAHKKKRTRECCSFCDVMKEEHKIQNLYENTHGISHEIKEGTCCIPYSGMSKHVCCKQIDVCAYYIRKFAIFYSICRFIYKRKLHELHSHCYYLWYKKFYRKTFTQVNFLSFLSYFLYSFEKCVCTYFEESLHWTSSTFNSNQVEFAESKTILTIIFGVFTSLCHIVLKGNE